MTIVYEKKVVSNVGLTNAIVNQKLQTLKVRELTDITQIVEVTIVLGSETLESNMTTVSFVI